MFWLVLFVIVLSTPCLAFGIYPQVTPWYSQWKQIPWASKFRDNSDFKRNLPEISVTGVGLNGISNCNFLFPSRDPMLSYLNVQYFAPGFSLCLFVLVIDRAQSNDAKRLCTLALCLCTRCCVTVGRRDVSHFRSVHTGNTYKATYF